MAYGKSKYGRRYARKNRAVKRVAKLARGKITAVEALAKSVRSIQRKMRGQHQILNFAYGEENKTMSANYEAINLCNFTGLNPVFGTSGNDTYDPSIIHSGFSMDMYFRCNTEPDLIKFTVFLVSLKDCIGNAFLPNTGQLNLVYNDHYTFVQGQGFLNKKVFNIHRVKRFQLTNNGSALTNSTAQTQFGTDLRLKWSMKCSDRITNPTGDWKSLVTAHDPSKQYFLLILNDNSSLDLESPSITYTRIHTMRTIA